MTSESAASNRGHSRARRLGYTILPGEGFSYVLHLRPREWPIMAAHTILGFILAQGIGPTARGERLDVLLLVLFSWVICLNGGTLALNSAFDNDEGDIGYLDAPPPPPRHLAPVAVGLMLIGGLVALALPAGFGFAYAACFTMSVLYSVPPFRLKAVAGADWVINMIGFGTLTPYAGWAATGIPVTEAGTWVLIAFCPLFAALYPLTQLYQVEEDRRRGDRTLAIILGIRPSLAVAIVMAVAAFTSFAQAARVAGSAWYGWASLAVAAAAWGWVLVPWYARAESLTPARHQRGMYAALGAWALTDAAVLVLMGSATR